MTRDLLEVLQRTAISSALRRAQARASSVGSVRRNVVMPNSSTPVVTFDGAKETVLGADEDAPDESDSPPQPDRAAAAATAMATSRVFQVNRRPFWAHRRGRGCQG